MATSIYADNGETGEHVAVEQNTAGHETVALRVDPERGTFIRLVNTVPQGEAPGIPLYMDLRDTNGNPLPPSTAFYWALKIAGQSQPVKVSEVIESIGDWNQLSLTQQRNTDHIDSTKVGLRQPESTGGGPLGNLDVRDIDELRLVLDSAAVVDWSQSSLYVENDAVKGPFQRE